MKMIRSKRGLVRSKKGLTLVELIVTVAILSIVSSMGVGIVANSINNYSKASIMSSEQATALDIESFIHEASRRCYGMQRHDTVSIPDANVCADYIYFQDGRLITLRCILDTQDEEPVILRDVYNGVKQVTFQLRKQRHTTDTTEAESFLYLSYIIEMDRGYVLEGSTVINGNLSDYNLEVLGEGDFYDANHKVEMVKASNLAVQFFNPYDSER